MKFSQLYKINPSKYIKEYKHPITHKIAYNEKCFIIDDDTNTEIYVKFFNNSYVLIINNYNDKNYMLKYDPNKDPDPNQWKWYNATPQNNYIKMTKSILQELWNKVINNCPQKKLYEGRQNIYTSSESGPRPVSFCELSFKDLLKFCANNCTPTGIASNLSTNTSAASGVTSLGNLPNSEESAYNLSPTLEGSPHNYNKFNGFTILNNPGNGDSLFYALGGLSNQAEQANNIRQQIVAHEIEFFENSITNASYNPDYIKEIKDRLNNMNNPGERGSRDEIQAWSNIKNAEIHVIGTDGKPIVDNNGQNIGTFSPFNSTPTEIIYLGYENGDHYVRLYPK